MAGRVCVVTGASSGIGRATAVGLARVGATVALVCRDRVRGEEARAEVGGDAMLFLADLSSQADIGRVAAELLERLPRIHVLVNNAGVVNLRHSLTADGIESVFAVNHLAYFLLTALLLDRLRASAPARIVNVASEAHRVARTIRFEDLGHAERWGTMRVYGHSKLANILFTYELARRLAGDGVTANCVHPGAVGTRLGQNNGRIATFLTRLLRPFFRTPEQGAATSLHVATAPALDGVTGRYFVDCREARSSRATYDVDLARRLWDESERLTGLAAAAPPPPASRATARP
jgi:NAD(P)-dependent dehydrogenase (short-subunit alcohol dehydrogenase family)